MDTKDKTEQDRPPTLVDEKGRPLVPRTDTRQPRWSAWTTDHSLVATGALSIISLCALVVSIYQARVLTSQQEAMVAQQEVMITNAKAQLWPNLLMGRNTNSDEEGRIIDMELMIINGGTGPVILEDVRVSVGDRYIEDHVELLRACGIADSLISNLSTAGFGRRTIQAGERVVFLRFNGNALLSSQFQQAIDSDLSPRFRFCYSSVFGDHWLLDARYGQGRTDVPEPLPEGEICSLGAGPRFN